MDAAFLAATRDRDLAPLLAILAPDVALYADAAAASLGAPREAHGAQAVARLFAGRARAARQAILDGAPGAAWVVAGRARVAFLFTIGGDRVAAIAARGSAPGAVGGAAPTRPSGSGVRRPG